MKTPIPTGTKTKHKQGYNSVMVVIVIFLVAAVVTYLIVKKVTDK